MSLSNTFLENNRSEVEGYQRYLAREDFGPHVKNPFTIVQVPCHAGETGLATTLKSYLSTNIHSGFQVDLLINGSGDTTQLDDEVHGFAAQHPDFPLRKFKPNTADSPAPFSTISGIRRCLAIQSLLTLESASDADLGNTVFVTHDADMLGMAPEYFDVMRDRFSDRSLLALGGAIRFSTESRILQLLLKVENAIFSNGLAAGSVKPKLCGANSVIRVESYLDAGGHNALFRRKVNIPIRNYLMHSRGKDSVQYDSQMWVSTSARRQEVCLCNGDMLTFQHQKFGQVGDYADSYRGGDSSGFSPDNLTDAQQVSFVEAQLTSLMMRNVKLGCAAASKRFCKKMHRIESDDMEKWLCEEPHLAVISSVEVEAFIKACRGSGISIEVSNFRVKIPGGLPYLANTMSLLTVKRPEFSANSNTL